MTHDAYHARPAEAVLSSLGATPTGLDADEAARRLSRHGPNALPEPRSRSALSRFLGQFKSVLVYFLLAAALAAFVLDHKVDAFVIAAVVLVNAVVGFVQEGKAEKALNAIRGLIAPYAIVLRAGEKVRVPARDIVPGDIVLVSAGDRVPADMRLTDARRLLVDEALLTGESLAAEKGVRAVAADAPPGDRSSMVFSGTLVAAGQGAGVVVATGLDTQIGHISRMLREVEPLATPLLRQIDAFARRFTWFVLAGALALFLFAVSVRGFGWVDALIAVVALAVGIVPEGLPAVITITLAIGVRRMAARNAVIRKLPAVETLGATSVICTDKTGTLTRNEMTARRVHTGGAALIVEGAGYMPEGRLRAAEGGDDEAARAASLDLIRCGLLCNDAALARQDGQWKVNGDPMEGALIALAMKAGLEPAQVRGEWRRLDSIPFDARHRFMATLDRGPDGEHVIFVKGAVEALLAMTGGDMDAARWNRRVEEAGAAGERVLAFGMKRIDRPPARLEPSDLSEGLDFLGLVGFIDPPRPEALDAVARCRSANIAVKMITGDHAATAKAIAAQLRIADDPVVATGEDIDALGDDALGDLVERVSVFARTSPEHKLRIVRALQANGHIVAMTGDGVNDAPALKQADVGTAMGVKGTEAAKEAAQMVLLDDNFASIVNAVSEGRTVHDNIRKVISWEIPTNGAETVAVVLAILVGFQLPMSATQILWVNLVLAATLGLVLAFEPPEPNVMSRRPRAADAPLLSPFLLWRIGLVSVLLAAAALYVFFHTLDAGRGPEAARTMAVNMFIVGELFYLFNVRYLHTASFNWRGLAGTPPLLIAIAVLVVAQACFTYVPFMNRTFGSAPLHLGELLLLTGIGAALMTVLELEKTAVRRARLFGESP